MKFFSLAVLALPALAAASILPRTGGGGTAPPASQCNTGPVQCCNSVQDSGSPVAQVAALLAGIGNLGAGIPVGLTCTPVTVIGAGGNSCSAQPVCCNNNNFNGAIALGCTPVNINL